jgi:CheY-like chemotaxis protein
MKTTSFDQRQRVLVVDDHEISLRHTVKALRQVAGLVKQARNAREAMESALDLLPNLIFMDIHLPETCGLSLLGKIRKAWPPDTPRPAFVILTGDNSPAMQQRLEQAAVSSVLVKPVQAETIRAIAGRLLHLDRGVREDALLDHAKARPGALPTVHDPG